MHVHLRVALLIQQGQPAETGALQRGEEFRDRLRSSQAAAHQHLVELHVEGELAQRQNVGDDKPAAGLEHPEDLAEHLILVVAQVDHAVGDDHVHRAGLEGDLLHHRMVKRDIGAGVAQPARHLLAIAVGDGEHLGRHVDAVHVALRPYHLGGQKDVEAGAAAEVDDHVAAAHLLAGVAQW